MLKELSDIQLMPIKMFCNVHITELHYFCRYISINKIMRRIFLLSIILIFPVRILSGSEPDTITYSDKVFSNKIKTVQLYKEGWNLSFPAMKLNSDEKIDLHFDLLDNQAETFYYSFIHCDKDWKKSDILPNDYLEGFYENPIDDYNPSFNTTVDYFHYKVSFPNDRVKFTVSGNYIIYVYPFNESEKPVLTMRFIVSEDAVNVTMDMHRPQLTTGDNARQQVDFTVGLNGINVPDPYKDIYFFVLQNGRWNNAKKNLKPEYFGNNEVKFSSLSQKNIFMGGNEFRYFDIKSIRYISEYISRIDFSAPYYNVFLKPSENREFKPYFYWKDFNGRYYIASQQGKDPETDADYVNVFFTLPSSSLIAGGQMYVSGNLNNWLFDMNNLMKFNPELNQYECTMLLKQGWYNYEYVFLKNGESDGVASKFEGSHYETENDYMVIVYFRNPRGRYDRILGTGIANTLNHLSY